MRQQQITVRDGRVMLTLAGKDYKARRHIGDIVGDTLHVQRDPAKHFFRQFNGYGFSYELMRDGSFERVIVHLPFGETLETTRTHILAKGRMLNFARNKLERQIFLSLDEFGLDRARETAQEIQPFGERAAMQRSLFEEGVQ